MRIEQRSNTSATTPSPPYIKRSPQHIQQLQQQQLRQKQHQDEEEDNYRQHSNGEEESSMFLYKHRTRARSEETNYQMTRESQSTYHHCNSRCQDTHHHHPSSATNVDPPAFEKLAKRVDWLYEEVRYIRHTLETLKQQQQQQLPSYDRHPYRNYSTETWDRPITQQHQNYRPDYMQHPAPPLTTSSTILASGRTMYRENRETRTSSQHDDAITSSIIRMHSYPKPTKSFGQKSPDSYPSLQHQHNPQLQHVNKVTPVHQLHMKLETSGHRGPDSPQSPSIDINTTKQHQNNELLPSQPNTTAAAVPSLQVPDKLEITDIVTLWERGLGDIPPICEWEPEDKIRNRNHLETLFKVYFVFRNSFNCDITQFVANFSTTSKAPSNTTSNKVPELSNASSPTSTSPPKELLKSPAFVASQCPPVYEQFEAFLEASPRHQETSSIESLLQDRIYTLPRKINGRKVSARDVIQLWEYGMGEVPPIKAWTKAQKFKQQSKISRWKKIVDIFKYQCNSDMRKFEEIYADGHGCLLPVAAITNRFETLYGDELNITSKLMTVPTPPPAAGDISITTATAATATPMTSIHASSSHTSYVNSLIAVQHQHRQRKRNLTDESEPEETDIENNLHHQHHQEDNRRDSDSRGDEERPLHLLGQHIIHQQYHHQHHKKRSYQDEEEDGARKRMEMKTPPPPLLVSVGSPPPPKLVKNEEHNHPPSSFMAPSPYPSTQIATANNNTNTDTPSLPPPSLTSNYGANSHSPESSIAEGEENNRYNNSNDHPQQHLRRLSSIIYILPDTITIKEAIAFWEKGSSDFPPVRTWTRTQNSIQNDLVIKLERLYSIYSERFHSDIDALVANALDEETHQELSIERFIGKHQDVKFSQTPATNTSSMTFDFSHHKTISQSTDSLYLLPRKINGRKVSAKDVLQLWYQGLNKIPPVKHWSPQQKAVQQSKISRWKKIVELFEQEFNGNWDRFHKHFSNSLGQLLPITAIIAKHEEESRSMTESSLNQQQQQQQQQQQSQQQ